MGLCKEIKKTAEAMKADLGATSDVYQVVMPLGMTVVPWGWPTMAQAYIDFGLWAIGQQDFLLSFERETGLKYVPPKTGLDRLIDDASGTPRIIIGKFLDWLTVNHWGEA